MFNNIGSGIKSLAKIILWGGIIASVILAIIMFVAAEEGSYKTEDTYITLGVTTLIFGPIVSIIDSMLVYGFGELITRTVSIDKKLDVKAGNVVSSSVVSSNPKVEILKKWKDEGIINEEEYAEKVNELQGE